MIEITFFEHQKSTGTTIQAKPGISLMKAALAGGIDGIAADCGGTLTCATCHVMVREPWLSKLPPAKEDERNMLDFAACSPQSNSRLACQIALTPSLNGMQVDVPQSQY